MIDWTAYPGGGAQGGLGSFVFNSHGLRMEPRLTGGPAMNVLHVPHQERTEASGFQPIIDRILDHMAFKPDLSHHYWCLPKPSN